MAGPRVRSLTPRQHEILGWVKEFIRDHGMAPTMREIGSAFDIKTSHAPLPRRNRQSDSTGSKPPAVSHSVTSGVA